MKIIIDQAIYDNTPNFYVGYNIYENITISDSPQMLKGRLQLFQESIYFDLLDESVTTYKNNLAVSKLYGNNTYTTLLHQISQSNYKLSENSAVDLTTFFSLQYGIPMHLYTMDHQLKLSLQKEQITTEMQPSNSDTIKQQLVQLFCWIPQIEKEQALKIQQAAGNMFIKINGGSFHTYLSSSPSNE